MTTNPPVGPTDRAANCPDGDSVVDIASALAAGDGPAAVSGYVFVDGETVVLSTDIRESYPAQPGEVTIPVRGLDLANLKALERVGDIAWTPQPVVLRGEVAKSVLLVATAC